MTLTNRASLSTMGGLFKAMEPTEAQAAEKAALDLAALCGRLCAVVEWCINNDGECLGDNPRQLAYAKQVLSDARVRADAARPPRTPSLRSIEG